MRLSVRCDGVIITVAFANSGNYGLPVVSFAFGSEALAFASLYSHHVDHLQHSKRSSCLTGPGFQDAISGLFRCLPPGLILRRCLQFDIACLPLHH
jgi:hypothetical protein